MQVNKLYVSVSFILEMYSLFFPNHKKLVLLSFMQIFIKFFQRSCNNSHDNEIMLYCRFGTVVLQ